MSYSSKFANRPFDFADTKAVITDRLPYFADRFLQLTDTYA